MQVHERKTREFIGIEDLDEILELIKNRIGARTVFLKKSAERIPATVSDCQPDHTLKLKTEEDFDPDGKALTFYALLDRYIEIDLEILEQLDAGLYSCKIIKMRKAAHGRSHIRFRMPEGQAVATNFRVSRQALDIGIYTIPTSIKVVLDQFQSSHSRMSDIVKVDIFRGEDSILLKNVKKTRKSLFIPDTSNPGSYAAAGEEFINCSEILGTDLKQYMQKTAEKGYKSMIIVPILYIDEAERTIPFGYIHLVSKSTPLTIETVDEMAMHSQKLVERIRDANTAFIQNHQEIVDISRGGMKLKITDNELKKILPKARGFIFDLVFKMQAPITIYGEIRVHSIDDEENLYVGIDFEGNSSRKNEMKRFYAFLDPMESDYKSKLKQTMRK